MYYQKGIDTGSANYGGDIFKNYATRSQDYGVKLVNGIKTQCAFLSFNASYELKENLFIDLGATHRIIAYDKGIFPTQRTTYVTGGIRLNFVRRDYNFY